MSLISIEWRWGCTDCMLFIRIEQQDLKPEVYGPLNLCPRCLKKMYSWSRWRIEEDTRQTRIIIDKISSKILIINDKRINTI